MAWVARARGSASMQNGPEALRAVPTEAGFALSFAYEVSCRARVESPLLAAAARCAPYYRFPRSLVREIRRIVPRFFPVYHPAGRPQTRGGARRVSRTPLRRACPPCSWPPPRSLQRALDADLPRVARGERQRPHAHAGQSLEGSLESRLRVRDRLQREPPHHRRREPEDHGAGPSIVGELDAVRRVDDRLLTGGTGCAVHAHRRLG